MNATHTSARETDNKTHQPSTIFRHFRRFIDLLDAQDHSTFYLLVLFQPEAIFQVA